MILLRRTACIVVCLLLWLGGPPASADTAAPVLIIVDGSGSMWGKMERDETAKLYGTRDLLRERLLAAPTSSRIGLASFGQRRKGDCSDVEILTPVEAGGAERAVAALDALNPKGKGPVTAAIREGVKAIGPGAAGHIILVHDNADNCSPDLCTATAEIAKTNPGLRVHVLSLGLSKPERERMRCLSETTGGLHFDAANRTDMAAGLKSIFEAAGLDAAAPAAPAPVAAAPVAEAKGPPGLKLSASLNANGAPVDAAIEWRIMKGGSSPDTPPLVERKSREINELVEPGTYAVSLSHGLIRRDFTIEVTSDGPVVRRLDLNGGRLAINAAASRQGDKLNAPMLTVSTVGDGAPGSGSVLWLGREADAELAVPAGRYVVEVSDGLARSVETVEVAPGASARADLVLDTGRLELTATASAGGPPLDRVLYLIFADDPAAPEGRREVARSTAAVADFTLQAGTYYITARHGGAERREQVAISSGDFVKRTLSLDVGRLTVNPRLSEPAAQSTSTFVTRVYRADGNQEQVGQSTASEPSFVLGAGRYRIETQVSMTNISTSAVVELTAGGEIATPIKLDAGTMTVSGLTGNTARAALRDESGRVVWRSRVGERLTALVAPGRYALLIDDGGAVFERPVNVEPGGTVTVDGAP